MVSNNSTNKMRRLANSLEYFHGYWMKYLQMKFLVWTRIMFPPHLYILETSKTYRLTTCHNNSCVYESLCVCVCAFRNVEQFAIRESSANNIFDTFRWRTMKVDFKRIRLNVIRSLLTDFVIWVLTRNYFDSYELLQSWQNFVWIKMHTKKIIISPFQMPGAQFS